MKSGNLNFLESSGPLQGCDGSDLFYLLNFLLTYLLNYLLTYLFGDRGGTVVKVLC